MGIQFYCCGTCIWWVPHQPAVIHRHVVSGQHYCQPFLSTRILFLIIINNDVDGIFAYLYLYH